MDPKLTLDKAKTRIRQKEAVQHQQGILRGNTDAHFANDLEEVKQTRSKRPSGTKSHKNDSTPGTSKTCTRNATQGLNHTRSSASSPYSLLTRAQSQSVTRIITQALLPLSCSVRFTRHNMDDVLI